MDPPDRFCNLESPPDQYPELWVGGRDFVTEFCDKMAFFALRFFFRPYWWQKKIAIVFGVFCDISNPIFAQSSSHSATAPRNMQGCFWVQTGYIRWGFKGFHQLRLFNVFSVLPCHSPLRKEPKIDHFHPKKLNIDKKRKIPLTDSTENTLKSRSWWKPLNPHLIYPVWTQKQPWTYSGGWWHYANSTEQKSGYLWQ